MSSQPPRIPGDSASHYRTWRIPELDSDKVLPSAEREDRERREREARARGEVIGESVESDDFNGPITAAELGKITEEAHREGYVAGFEQGHAEGLKTGSAEGEKAAYAETKEKLTQNLNSLAQLLDGLSDPYETHTQQLQEYILTTVMALAASVVKREIGLQPVEVQRVVDMAIDALPKSSRDIVVNLHPDDIHMLRETFPHKATQWQLQENTELTRGGVIVRTKDSVVDYSIERQLIMLEERLLRGELAQREDSDSSDSETD